MSDKDVPYVAFALAYFVVVVGMALLALVNYIQRDKRKFRTNESEWAVKSILAKYPYARCRWNDKTACFEVSMGEPPHLCLGFDPLEEDKAICHAASRLEGNTEGRK